MHAKLGCATTCDLIDAQVFQLGTPDPPTGPPPLLPRRLQDYQPRESGVDRTTRREIEVEEAGMRLNYKHRELQGEGG